MDGDQISINVLPNEILLFMFRKLSAMEFITTLPCVCERWSKIVASDSHTIKQIAMRHFNISGTVDFIYLENQCQKHILFCNVYKCDHFQGNVMLSDQSVSYETAFYLSTQHSEIFGQIKTLMIIGNMNVYHEKGFTCVDNLTTIIFYKVKIVNKDSYILLELDKVYSNIQSVMYISCSLQLINFDKKFLYYGFKRLKRFRLDHYSVSYRFLEDLLKAHPKLVEIVFNECCTGNINDRWIDVLIDKLKGRTIKILRMHSSYITDECVNRLKTSGLIASETKLSMGREILSIPFSIIIN